MLNVPLLSVRQADHGDRTRMGTGGDHRLDIFEFERAVLHLKPRIVVMFGLLAVTRRVHRGLRETEHLLAGEQLLFGRVVQLSGRQRGKRIPSAPSASATTPGSVWGARRSRS